MVYQKINLPTPSDIAMIMTYRVLWGKLPCKSVVSGLWLRDFETTPLWKNCFLHLLNTKDYPYFAFYFRNIVLITPGELALWEQATEEERIKYSLGIEERTGGKKTADWTVLKRLQALLIEEYRRSFPVSRGLLINVKYDLAQQKNIVGKLNKKYILSLNE